MRKTLKRGAAFCLAAMMALTACGAKSGNSGETGGQAAETKAQTQAEEKTEVRHLTLAAVAGVSWKVMSKMVVPPSGEIAVL